MGATDASAARWEGRNQVAKATAWTLDLGHSAFRCVATATGWVVQSRLAGKGWEPFTEGIDPHDLLLKLAAAPLMGALIRGGK